jgi:uncharacterized protein involved in outer membrane biogenesis
MVKILIFFATLFAIAALAWMVFLPRIAERELRAATGFDVSVRVLSANPFTGRLVVKGLSARNPPGYPEPDFIDLESLDSTIDLFSVVTGGQVVIDSLDVNIAKLEIIRLHGGRSNIAECAAKVAPSSNAVPAKEKTAGRGYLIRTLHVRLGELVLQDYSGSVPEKKVYPLNIIHTYANVTDSRQLLVPDVVNTLYKFGLHHDLARLLPGEFGEALAAAVDGVGQVGSKVKDTARKAGDFLKGLVDKLEQSQKP